MIAIYRVLLGLPLREEDINQLRKDFPEFFDNFEFSPELKKRLRRRTLFLPYFDLEDILEKILREIKEFDSNKKPIQKGKESDNCPACGYPDSIKKASEIFDVEEEFIYHLQSTLAGIEGKQHPIYSFLNLVQHKCDKDPDTIYITDSYILTKLSTTKKLTDKHSRIPKEGKKYKKLELSGEFVGYDNVIKFIDTLLSEKNHTFTLKILKNLEYNTPDDSVRKEFQRILKDKYKNIKFDQIAGDFHDRFYLTRKNGKLKGVHGPSMSGLTSHSIVLIGELDSKVIHQLSKII